MDVGSRKCMRSPCYVSVWWCICGINRNMKDNVSLFRPVEAQKTLVEKRRTDFGNWHLKIQPSTVKNCHSFMDEISLWVSPAPTAAIQFRDMRALNSVEWEMYKFLLMHMCVHTSVSLYACLMYWKRQSLCLCVYCLHIWASPIYCVISVLSLGPSLFTVSSKKLSAKRALPRPTCAKGGLAGTNPLLLALLRLL